MRMPPSQKQNSISKATLSSRRAYPVRVVHRALGRLSTSQLPVIITEEQRRLVLTGFVLGCFSIVTAFFPICGLPISITGLFIGLYGRRTTALRIMSSWTIVLSLVGLIISFINLFVMISIFFGTYIWQ